MFSYLFYTFSHSPSVIFSCCFLWLERRKGFKVFLSIKAAQNNGLLMFHVGFYRNNLVTFRNFLYTLINKDRGGFTLL